MTQESFALEAAGVLSSASSRVGAALNLANWVAERIGALLSLFGGVDAVIAFCHQLYERHAVPFDIPILTDTTEHLYDVANKAAIADIIRHYAGLAPQA